MVVLVLLPLAADHGFDPLGLGSSPEQLAWNTHAEIFHGRLAMTGVAGILFTSVSTRHSLCWHSSGQAGIHMPQDQGWR